MNCIERKTLLYKTGVEYGDYTINHALGCSHGCLYPCYAFMMARRFGRVHNYKEWCNPLIVKNSEELLIKELPRLRNKIKSVQFCFTTDPFMVGFPDIKDMTIRLLDILESFNVPATVLTKGVLPNELVNTSKDNSYGISLVSLNETFRKEYEPFTANIDDRIKSLETLHKDGYHTWVSIEPFPTPNIIDQSLSDILERISFVDRIIFGRWHYNSLINKYPDYIYFYNNSADKVIKFCCEQKIDYHIKIKTITN